MSQLDLVVVVAVAAALLYYSWLNSERMARMKHEIQRARRE